VLHICVSCCREFFANRAAAQAVKARVEAYDRYGGERLQMPLAGGAPGVMGCGAGGGGGGGGGGRSQPNSRRGSEVEYVVQAQQPGSRRNSEVDRDHASYQQQQQHYQQQPSHYAEDDRSHRGAGGGGSYYEDDKDAGGHFDAEARIAYIKAQKEREREREMAEKALQVLSPQRF
jgi:hypothetical protein